MKIPASKERGQLRLASFYSEARSGLPVNPEVVFVGLKGCGHRADRSVFEHNLQFQRRWFLRFSHRAPNDDGTDRPNSKLTSFWSSVFETCTSREDVAADIVGSRYGRTSFATAYAAALSAVGIGRYGTVNAKTVFGDVRSVWPREEITVPT
jgi:hypothetical protein